MAINRFAQFRAMVNGVGVHFVHERGVGDHPLPIILTHGYPDSFWRFSKIIPMLTHPEAHRADPADAFDVVGVTETIGSAFLPYADFVNAGALTLAVEAFRQWIGSTDAPAAFAMFPKDISHPPREWAARYFNVQRWTEMPRGGHFAALEEPELLVDDIRRFFRPLRTSD